MESDRSNPELFFNAANIEIKTEDYEEAKNHINEAIKLDEKNGEYHILLAKIYAKGYKDKNKTLESIENGLKNGYNNPLSLQGMDEFKLLKEYPEFKKLIDKYSKSKTENSEGIVEANRDDNKDTKEKENIKDNKKDTNPKNESKKDDKKLKN